MKQNRWRVENYIKNKATRTGNQFKERTNTSSREINRKRPINRNRQENTKRTYYTCGRKGHKIKDCES